MPNWCNNTLSITGPKDKIADLWTEAKKSGLLNAMKPMPEALEETTSPAPKPGQSNYKGPQPKVDGFDNWYDWRVANWGTKWEVDTEGLELSEDGTEITGWFDSAWAPPIEAYNTFCENNEDCTLESFYEEGGMDFAGHYDNGDDDYIEGISDYAREKIKTGESGSSLYDFLDGELELTEARREYIEEELEEETSDA
jgi:hypothetical protein